MQVIENQYGIVGNQVFNEYISTGISTVKTGSTPLHEDVYGIDGRSRQTIQRGINIIRSSDGTTKKVLQR